MFTTEWDGVKLMGIGSEITGMWKECTETVETGKDEGKLLSSSHQPATEQQYCSLFVTTPR